MNVCTIVLDKSKKELNRKQLQMGEKGGSRGFFVFKLLAHFSLSVVFLLSPFNTKRGQLAYYSKWLLLASSLNWFSIGLTLFCS